MTRGLVARAAAFGVRPRCAICIDERSLEQSSRGFA